MGEERLEVGKAGGARRSGLDVRLAVGDVQPDPLGEAGRGGLDPGLAVEILDFPAGAWSVESRVHG